MGHAGYEETVEQSSLGERSILVRGYSPRQSEAERQAARGRLERQLYDIYHAFLRDLSGASAQDGR